MAKGDKTKLGDRIKLYEALAPGGGIFMPRLPIVCRMDGRGFSRWTKGLEKPFDRRLSNLMIQVAKLLVAETNARVGYTQSDEITLVLLADDVEQQVWFNSRISKILSHLGGLTSLFFNYLLPDFIPEKVPAATGGHAPTCQFRSGTCECGAWDSLQRKQLPSFDARAFNVPDVGEAMNALLWRERDATRNSVSMAAQSLYSHRQLEGMRRAELMDMLHAKGVNWNNFSAEQKRGVYVKRRSIQVPIPPEKLARIPNAHLLGLGDPPMATRTVVDRLDLEPLDSYTMEEKIRLLIGDPDKEV